VREAGPNTDQQPSVPKSSPSLATPTAPGPAASCWPRTAATAT